jgi:hypothetical protein
MTSSVQICNSMATLFEFHQMAYCCVFSREYRICHFLNGLTTPIQCLTGRPTEVTSAPKFDHRDLWWAVPTGHLENARSGDRDTDPSDDIRCTLCRTSSRNSWAHARLDIQSAARAFPSGGSKSVFYLRSSVLKYAVCPHYVTCLARVIDE